MIAEEIHAWECGFELAKEIGIAINTKKWERYSKKQIYDYIKWGVNGG